MMELLLFMSTLVYRYDFKLANPEQKQLDIVEGFLRKVSFDDLPVSARIRLMFRSVIQ